MTPPRRKDKVGREREREGQRGDTKRGQGRGERAEVPHRKTRKAQTTWRRNTPGRDPTKTGKKEPVKNEEEERLRRRWRTESRREDNDANFLGKETAAATAWSMPARQAVDKEITRDNSAQREDPIAKELRFDRVTKKMNKNHRRPIYGGEDEATKEEERQKKLQAQRRCEAPEEMN